MDASSFNGNTWRRDVAFSARVNAISDQGAVAATAYARLRQSPYLSLRGTRCHFRDGVLTLSGRVPSYHLKQIAQSLVLSLEGVAGVRNELQVV